VCGHTSSVVGLIRECGFSPAPDLARTDALPAGGPGAELKKLLARVGITATPDCSCNARAAEMDRQGVDWCEQNVDTIVGWLREQAAARGLPFVDLAGRMLVRLAVKNARRANVDR